MASQNLYPPIIDGAMAAFAVQSDKEKEQSGQSNSCKVYFSLSKFNVTNDFSSVHISLKRQATGVNCVQKDEVVARTGVYRSTGIIIMNKMVDDVETNLIHKVDDVENLYYIEIFDEDLNEYTQKSDKYTGWQPGIIYQLQIRLSEVGYTNPSIPQESWLNDNANRFSEWSTLCALKPISHPYLTSSHIGYPGDTTPLPAFYTTTSADLYFDYNRPVEDKEDLYCYQFILGRGTYPTDFTVLEQSDLLYTTRSEDPNVLQYTLTRTDLVDGTLYQLLISYTTINNFNEVVVIPLKTDFNSNEVCDLSIEILNEDTIYGVHDHHKLQQNDSFSLDTPFSTIGKENEEGYIAIKLTGQIGGTLAAPHSEYILRRASSKDNFTYWEDIKNIKITNAVYGGSITLIIKDMTVESGIFYQYGIQNLNSGYRGALTKYPLNPLTTTPPIREFDHSYLLGENDRQLKLEFDNTLNNLSFNIDDGVQKTYGMFPVVVRPGASRYRTFPVNGLISFYMDENDMFTTRNEVYGSSEVTALYERRDTTKASQQYNYVYEREFRNKVMQFLQDGRPKLFKSPTEGNILIRITGVSFSPNQTLSRLVYSFSATGTEIGEVNSKNLTKYKIMNKEFSAECTPPNN